MSNLTGLFRLFDLARLRDAGLRQLVEKPSTVEIARTTDLDLSGPYLPDSYELGSGLNDLRAIGYEEDVLFHPDEDVPMVPRPIARFALALKGAYETLTGGDETSGIDKNVGNFERACVVRRLFDAAAGAILKQYDISLYDLPARTKREMVAILMRTLNEILQARKDAIFYSDDRLLEMLEKKGIINRLVAVSKRDLFRLALELNIVGKKILEEIESSGFKGDLIEGVNAFLRGALGREPDFKEVMVLSFILKREEFKEIREVIFYGKIEGGDNPQIFQIFSRQFLDEFAEYLEKLVQEFIQRNGREPKVVEICAGDGRFAAGLNSRLAAKGIFVEATDDMSWGIAAASGVRKSDMHSASADGDIILGIWLPRFGDDLNLGQTLKANPEKLLITIGERGKGRTSSRDFREFASKHLEQSEVVELSDLSQSRIEFVDGTETSGVFLYRAKDY